MKKYFIILFLSLLSFNLIAKDNIFINGFDDLPLMNGLEQLENDNFVFGNEETRLVETKLISKQESKFDKINLFYKNTLPQLGWNLIESNNINLVFHRENDVLEISEISKKPLLINVRLRNKD